MPNIHDNSFVGRMAEIEPRLSAMERRPMSVDTPFELTRYQNFDSTGRAVPVTIDDWVLCYYSWFPTSHIYPAIYVEVHVLCPVGTTAEVRLTDLVEGGSVSGAYSIGSGEDFRRTYHWLHGQPLGTGPFAPGIECRRTAGSGTVQCFMPTTPMLMTQQSVNVLGGFSTDGRLV